MLRDVRKARRRAGEGEERWERVLLLVQGGSYVGFGVWALLAREHYARVHGLEAHPWLLRQHGAWLTLVGSQLLACSLQRRSSRGTRPIAIASAASLVANDVYSSATGRLAPIYRRDLAFESVLLGAWGGLVALRRSVTAPRRGMSALAHR